MQKSEIEKRRARSKAGNSKYRPWATDYEELAKKTIIRYMWKYLLVSVEMQNAVSHDEGVGRSIKDITPDDDSYVDMPEIVADYPQNEEDAANEN